MVYPESYIVCFSSQYNDSSMWGNYADHHKGVCLIYETDENNGITLDMKNASCRHEVLPVRYGGDTMERNFFETFGRLNPRQIRTWLTGLDGISSAYDAFSDEDEWRKRYWEVFQVKTYQKNPAGSMNVNTGLWWRISLVNLRSRRAEICATRLNI